MDNVNEREAWGEDFEVVSVIEDCPATVEELLSPEEME